jgi:hypothetical protein
MFRAFHSARKKSLTSSFALALALAAGTAIGVAGFAEPAYAQKKPKVTYSEGFVAAYTPVEQAQKAIGDTGDHTPLKAQLPAMVAAIENADDRFAAGQFVLAVGNKTNDPALQRQGLELTLASGKVDPAQLGQLQFFVGSLAFQAKDYAAARTALEAAKTAGYGDDDVHSLLIEAYLQGGATAEGLDYLTKLARERAAAGTPVSEKWLRRGLAVAYRDKLAASSNELAAMLVANTPTADNWQASLQVVREINKWSSEEVLDLSRLMQLSGGLKTDYDLAEYVEAADPRKLSNEVIAALDAATKAGLIPANAPRFAEFRTIAQERAAADRAEAAKAPGQVQASGTAALATGDLLLSVGSYADAEAMYQQALDKGGVDANRALTRKGIAQLRQGKTAEAKATFAQVQGTRASLAHLWTIYADRGTVAAAAAAPTPAG